MAAAPPLFPPRDELSTGDGRTVSKSRGKILNLLILEDF
jgi:hypothetical protein